MILGSLSSHPLPGVFMKTSLSSQDGRSGAVRAFKGHTAG